MHHTLSSQRNQEAESESGLRDGVQIAAQDASISVIIPCFNEAGRIVKTMARIQEYAASRGSEKSKISEIICIENGSSDGTLAVLHRLAHGKKQVPIRIHRSEKGKGRAVKEGVRHAQGSHALVMDADGSTDISYVDHMMKRALEEGFDIVNTSRRMHGAHVHNQQKLFRRMSGDIVHAAIRTLFTLPVSDTQNGFKLYKSDIARNLYAEAKTHGWLAEVELFSIAKKKKYRMHEIPVVWNNDQNSQLGYKDIFPVLRDLCRIWVRSMLKGKGE